MPIRDHFAPPLDALAGWEELHTIWISNLLRGLNRKWLPGGYRAVVERYFEPRLRAGGSSREPGAVCFIEAPLYGTAYRPYMERRDGQELPRIDLWLRSLSVGDELPVLPLFIDTDLAVPIELEQTYVETCEDLRLPEPADGEPPSREG